MNDSQIEKLNRKFDNLEASIRLALQIVPKHLRNAFTGMNVRKRRDEVLMPDFALWFGKYLCHPYLFYSGDVLVEEADMVAFLLQWFRDVPISEAKICGAKSTMESEPAREKLAADLHAAITEKWRSVYSPSHLRQPH